MTGAEPGSALTAAVHALLDGHDATSELSALTATCAQAFDCAVGVLVAENLAARERGSLDLLAASSHQAAALELYQLQTHDGPCLDAIGSDEEVAVFGAGHMAERWPQLAEALTAAGYGGAMAMPLRWRGEVFGAMNLFLRTEQPLPEAGRATVRGLADVAAAIIVFAQHRPRLGEVADAVHATLQDRVLVEQAKGALRHLLGVEEGRAYDVLQARAGVAGTSLTAVARELVDAVARGEKPSWLTESIDGR